VAVRRCKCQQKKIAEERIRTILDEWPEYREAALDTYEPKSEGQRLAVEAIRGNPRGSYFINGSFSRGKTHLMIAQYQHLALAGERCLLRSARDLMEEFRKAEAPPDREGKQYESPVLQLINLAPAGHLFVDDIEKASARSEFRAEMIFDLLDTIKRRQLGITVMSNLPLVRLGVTSVCGIFSEHFLAQTAPWLLIIVRTYRRRKLSKTNGSLSIDGFS
jgi:DNA replication protein DnaC